HLQATPVSDGIRRIVQYINAHPKCSRRQLVEALAPSPPLPVTPADTAAPPAGTPTAVEPTPEQTALVADLHWLVHQGHVIEFANGTLETAKKPLPKPPKPERKAPAEPAVEAAPESAAPAAEPVPAEHPASPSEAVENTSAPETETAAAAPELAEAAAASETSPPAHRDETVA